MEGITQYNLQILLPGAEGLEGPTITCQVPEGPALQAAELLGGTGVQVADLRSRAILVVGDDPQLACAIYSAVIGLSGRMVDITDGRRIVIADQISAAASNWNSLGRPGRTIAVAQLGREHDSILSVGAGTALNPGEVTVVSYAKKLRFVPPADPLVALTQLIAVAAVRRRGLDHRLPVLVSGDEPAETEGLMLEEVRRAGQMLRRAGEQDAGGRETVEKEPPTARLLRLAEASQVDMAETLIRLGARQNEQTGLWHCPRPERHTNGDANASMKLSDTTTRCFRCDAEKVDPVRLVADTLACSFDEAADWLMSGAVRQTA